MSAALLLLLAAVIAYGQTNGFRGFSDDTDTAANDTPAENDYAPPTEEEKQSGDKKKEEIEQEQQNPSTPPDQPVKPFITDAGQYDNQIEVRSYVPSIYETGGTCTATFTKGGSTVTRTVNAAEDATTTRCKVFIVPRSAFPSTGNWSVTVKYKSAAYSGTSDPSHIEVE